MIQIFFGKGKVIELDADVENFLASKFTKIKLLRESDKGAVWLATSSGGELVIFKQINFVGLPYAELKKISCDLLAKIFYCVEGGGKTFVVEEFLHGENLTDKKISETATRKYILQLCDGLKVLHGLKIIHRDIKPANLILQGDKIRLIDFDAARVFKTAKSHDTKFLGTKGYAPPEQFGFGQTDARSDIFSLGKTFQELVGKNCSADLKKILAKCTELDPANRYQSVEDLKSALLEKKSPAHKKFFAASLIFAGILFFHANLHEENFTAPEKVVEQNLPAKKIPERRAEKTFQFPEIKFPDAETPAPEKIPAPKISAPETVPEPAPKIQRDFVAVKYFLNGERMAAWVDNWNLDIDNAGWLVEINSVDGWRGGNFPAWQFEVKVENFTDKNFTNAALEVTFNDNGRLEQKIFSGGTIPAGGEKVFKIPLNQFRVTDFRAAGENYMSKHNFTFKFSGDGAEIHGTAFFVDFIFKL